jgi:hypothetical protein
VFIREISNMKGRTVVALVSLAVAASVFSIMGYKMLRELRIREVYGTLSPTAGLVSRYLRDFNVPKGKGYRRLYEQFRGERWAEFFEHNEYNRGAEMLYAVLGGHHPWTTDTDGDGRPEASDERGDPLIFLTHDLPSDTVFFRRDGETGQKVVDLPPYFGDGVYINLQSFHAWRHADHEELSHVRSSLHEESP